MSPNPALVRLEVLGAIAVLTLDRPSKRNALSRALIAELADALDEVGAEPGVRAIVLAAEGPTFCAGMDLSEATDGLGDTGEASQAAVDDTRAIADLLQQVHTSSRPVVAALQGDAYGGGAGLATACDLVVMADSAKIGYPEARRGLVAAIVLHDLARQVGDRRARELLLLGEPIGAATALAWGLANRVVPADRCRAEAEALARALAQSGPTALSTTKNLLDEASRRPADLRSAAAVSAAVRDSDEAREGMLAFLEKRPPRWSAAPPADVPPTDRRDGSGIPIDN